MSLKRFAVVVWAGGMVVLGGCEGFPFQQKPPEYQEVGVIQLQERLVPEEIVLRNDMPARLHIVGGGGRETQVRIAALDLTIAVTPGKASTVVLERGDIAKLDGGTLEGEGGQGPARFVMKGKGGGAKAARNDGRTEVAVVLTDQLAAPRQATVTCGRPVVMYIGKGDSDVGFDDFQCEELGIKVKVMDREIKKLDWTPAKAGTYVFTGTVTPDSQVRVVVVDAEH